MPRRNLATVINRILGRFALFSFSRRGGTFDFLWTSSRSALTPVRLRVWHNRAIACYVPTTVVITDEFRASALEWLATTNAKLEVGSFQLATDGTVIFRNSIDAEALDAKTLERVVPGLWLLAVKTATSHAVGLERALNSADLDSEVRDDWVDDTATGILHALDNLIGEEASIMLDGAVRQVVQSYADLLIELNPIALAEPQYDITVFGVKTTFVLRAGQAPPIRYTFDVHQIEHRLQEDKMGLLLYYHGDPRDVQMILDQGFRNERQEILLEDTFVNDVPEGAPEVRVTHRVLLTSRPRPMDDRTRGDRTLGVRWNDDANALAHYAWGKLAITQEANGWSAASIPQSSRQFLVPAAVLNHGLRTGRIVLEMLES